MTDLERKLAEALRGQAEEVTPNLDAAWAEQQRRQRRPRMARRRLTLVVAPLAAVLVVLTSVLLVSRMNIAPAPTQPADGIEVLNLASFAPQPFDSLRVVDVVELADFAGQTDTWSAFAFAAVKAGTGDQMLCVAAVPAGQRLEAGAPQYSGSPRCKSLPVTSPRPLSAGYVGEVGGPLPPGKAVFFVDPAVQSLQLFDNNGDLTQARVLGERLMENAVFLADMPPDTKLVRFRAKYGPFSSTPKPPASR